MPNKEFNELMAQQGKNSAERANIIQKMKENLKSRNGGKNLYSFGYTDSGKEVNIDTCSAPEDLFAINGDMCPLGKQTTNK